MLEDIITPPQRELLDEVCDELGVLIKVAMMRPRVVRY
jgi:hypothetical protein